MEAAGLPEEKEEELRSLISNKNFFGVEEFIDTLALEADLRQLFSMLGNLYTGTDDLKAAKELSAKYPKILHAIENLEELHGLLKAYDIEKYISFELGMLSNYQYYTGIIFAGYTFGSGEPIVKGGRYDKLLTHFGKDSASIGFAIVVDQLMAALARQKIEIPIEYHTELIVYQSTKRTEAIATAQEIRQKGGCVELMAQENGKTRADYDAYAKRNHIVRITFM